MAFALQRFTRPACASLGRMSMEAIMIKVRIEVSVAVKKLRTFGAAFDQRRALSEIGDSANGSVWQLTPWPTKVTQVR